MSHLTLKFVLSLNSWNILRRGKREDWSPSCMGVEGCDRGALVPPHPVHASHIRVQILKLLRSPGIDSKEPVPPGCVCSLAGRYDNPIPTLFLAPIDCFKIPAHSDKKISSSSSYPVLQQGASEGHPRDKRLGTNFAAPLSVCFRTYWIRV